MTKQDIIQNNWKIGRTTLQVAKIYMKKHNKEAKQRKEPKISEDQELAYVEPIIFDYETKDWK